MQYYCRSPNDLLVLFDENRRPLVVVILDQGTFGKPATVIITTICVSVASNISYALEPFAIVIAQPHP